MQKVWLIIIRRIGVGTGLKAKVRQLGFSTVEVLLAATVLGMLVTAITGALVYGRSSSADAGDTNRAQFLADEGVEAVRNIRDAAFGNLTNGTFGLANNSGIWTLSGTSDITDIYTRQVVISSVDSVRKSVVVTVSWTTGSNTQQVTATTRFNSWSAALVTGPIMMVYSKTTNTPFYRIWNGSAWGTEGSAMTVGGNINYIVLKSSRTRNEAVLGTQDASGAIYFQVWNGTAWGNRTQVGTGTTTMRGFDIAYERKTDRAIIAFQPSAASPDFSYRIWDGTTLLPINAVTTPPTTGAMNWIELRQNPLMTSNDIAMITLDSNSDVYGMMWNGSSWGTMGVATTWDNTAASATKKAIDVEYEQNSGEAMFMWGDSVATDQYYRTWNGTTLSAATLLDIAAEGGVAEWIQLAARPSSDEIMLGVQDTGADLNTRKWSGTAWDTATQHAEHSAATENILSRNFDIVWETHASNPGKAWLLWGNGATVTQKLWNGTSWGSGSVLSGSDDTSFIRLRADPISGAVFAGIYQNITSAAGARDIGERHLTGGSATWTAKAVMWGGPTTAEPVTFKIDIATP